MAGLKRVRQACSNYTRPKAAASLTQFRRLARPKRLRTTQPRTVRRLCNWLRLASVTEHHEGGTFYGSSTRAEEGDGSGLQAELTRCRQFLRHLHTAPNERFAYFFH